MATWLYMHFITSKRYKMRGQPTLFSYIPIPQSNHVTGYCKWGNKNSTANLLSSLLEQIEQWKSAYIKKMHRSKIKKYAWLPRKLIERITTSNTPVQEIEQHISYGGITRSGGDERRWDGVRGHMSEIRHEILVQTIAVQMPLTITDRGGKAKPRPYFSLRSRRKPDPHPPFMSVPEVTTIEIHHGSIFSASAWATTTLVLGGGDGVESQRRGKKRWRES